MRGSFPAQQPAAAGRRRASVPKKDEAIVGRWTQLGTSLTACALLLLVVLPRAADAATYTPPASTRLAIALDGTWRFLRADSPGSELPGFDDSSWSTVTVPHTWNNVDGQDGPDTGGDPNGRNYYRGIGRYRRHVSLPLGYAGRRLFLQFDGSNLITDVWVNGFYVGRHEGGFTAFRFDVTDVVNTAPGNDNVIAVKVDNSNPVGIAPLSADFTFFGGIYREVALIATDPLALDMLDFGSAGVYLTQRAVSQASADLEIKSLVRNASAAMKTFAVKSIVVDRTSTIVATRVTRTTLAAFTAGTVFQNVTVVNPHLWDGLNDPYLYSVFVEIHDGDETGPLRDLAPPQPLGFRWYSLDPNAGFFLNGHYLDLHGVNRHQDRLNKGWAISQADHDQDMRLIEEIGATAVRLAHYPHAQYFYSLADKNGMIVWAELPIVNGVGGAAFAANARLQLIELIRQNYNHPAIVFWSLANEIKLGASVRDPMTVLTDLNALAKQEDATRITTLAHCCASDTDPTTTVTDTVAYNPYFGWYYGSSSEFGGWADTLHRTTPQRTIAVSEYGAGASILAHAENAGLSDRHYEEYQARLHETHWIAMKTRPFLWGKFVWNMFDFASDSRNEGDTPGRNDKGLVTYDRVTRKDAFYWYKANWRTTPVVYIASRRWTERTVSTTDVKVYSNGDSVELLVNGVSLGSRSATAFPDRVFTWKNVVLNAGANTVHANAWVAGAIVTDAVTWNLASPPPAGGFSAAINFQPAGAPTVAGYLIDGGAVFGDRGNGLRYGWSQDAAAGARDRNSSRSPDQRYDTLIHMGTLTWEIAVPNGTYTVRTVVGDPSYFDLTAKLLIEGALAINGATSTTVPWLEGTVTVTVSDGRLTLTNQAGSYDKICFVEINSTTAPPPATAIRLNVGSSAAFTDSSGSVWQADQFGSGGTLSSKSNAVANTVDDDLYRTYRFGTFTYAIPVPNGTYDVTIKCMETWWSAAGQRLFDVSAEGVTKLANLDLFATAGQFAAVDKTFSVTVSDGVLNLSFSASVDNAIVSAIAVTLRP